MKAISEMIDTTHPHTRKGISEKEVSPVMDRVERGQSQPVLSAERTVAPALQ